MWASNVLFHTKLTEQYGKEKQPSVSKSDAVDRNTMSLTAINWLEQKLEMSMLWYWANSDTLGLIAFHLYFST